MNISHSSVSFHIFNCLSVIGRGRERWSDPVPYFFFAPLILPINFGLPAFSLSRGDWQLKIIAFIMCGVSFQALLCFSLWENKKMSGPVSLFISSIGRLMRETVLSQAFSDRLQSPCTGGPVSVCLWSSHRLVLHCSRWLRRLAHDQNYILQLS